jgi:hypothetical protein
MPSVALTGKDSIQIDQTVITDLADGDSVSLTFPNDLGMVKASKNGNAIYAMNEMGRIVECSIRVMVGSFDHKFLNSRLQEMKNDFSNFILLQGTFSKRVGDGLGNMTTVVYQCTGGVFKKQVEAKTSSEGDTEQSVAVFAIVFKSGESSIQ